MADKFNALIRMLELRLQRQVAALKETEDQLNEAREAANPSRQADLLANAGEDKKKR